MQIGSVITINGTDFTKCKFIKKCNYIFKKLPALIILFRKVATNKHILIFYVRIFF